MSCTITTQNSDRYLTYIHISQQLGTKKKKKSPLLTIIINMTIISVVIILIIIVFINIVLFFFSSPATIIVEFSAIIQSKGVHSGSCSPGTLFEPACNRC